MTNRDHFRCLTETIAGYIPIMLRVASVAIALMVVTTGMVDHAGPNQVPEPSPSVSTTYFVHTPCVYVNPGGQWRYPPGEVPPMYP